MEKKSVRLFCASLFLLVVKCEHETNTKLCSSSKCFKIHSDLSTMSAKETPNEFCKRENGIDWSVAAIINVEDFQIANSLLGENSSAFIGYKRSVSYWHWALDLVPLYGQGCRANVDEGLVTVATLFQRNMSHSTCFEFCSNASASFYAITSRSLCYCTANFAWSQPSQLCSMACEGDEKQVCGSFSASNVYSISPNFDNWLAEHPKPDGGNCAALSKIANGWINKECSDKLPFICQFVHFATVEPSPKFEYQQRVCNDGVCFYLFMKDFKNWYESDRFCLENGGRLASIGNQQRQGMIQAMFWAYNGVLFNDIWIGANNLLWHYDQLIKPDFNGWLPSSKDKLFYGSDICTEMANTDNGLVGWRSRKCDIDKNDDRILCSGNLKAQEELHSVVKSAIISNFSEPVSQISKSVSSTPEISANETAVEKGNVEQVKLGQCRKNDDSWDFPWWDIVLLVLLLISMLTSAVFIALYCSLRLHLARGQRSSNPTSSQHKRKSRQQGVAPFTLEKPPTPNSARNSQQLLY